MANRIVSVHAGIYGMGIYHCLPSDGASPIGVELVTRHLTGDNGDICDYAAI